LETFDARDVGTPDQKKYEMRFFATVSFSGDKLRCRRSLCPELHNYLLEVDQTAKRANVAELFESDWLLPLVYGSLSYSR
jgi:hypothetical protein